MIKHSGKHGDKKVVVLYNTVPEEEHMCLVCYPDVLPVQYHDGIMRVLESDVGQQAKNFADALHRNVFANGNNMLHTLHKEGMIKKVQTNQVTILPNAKSKIRLDELNSLLSQIDSGGEAAKVLADNDKGTGMADPEVIRHAAETRLAEEAREKVLETNEIEGWAPPPNEVEEGLVGMTGLATANLTQAQQIEAQIAALQGEASRLTEEAYSMDPSLKPKRGRGRPKGSANKKTAA
jgi:hypothetical protein